MNRTQAPSSWTDVRAVVFDRDGGRCVECKTTLTSLEAHVHHVIPRAFGGSDREDNLITLCQACHAGRHRNLQGVLGSGLIERWAWRLARWLDHELVGQTEPERLGAVIRLFGATRLRPGQLEAILAAARGESVLYVSPTGSGKSLCFQAPTLLNYGAALVVSPLKALMSDQVGGLHKRHVPATFINGDLSPAEKRIRYRLLRRGSLKFLYCAPERFDKDRVQPAEVAEMERVRPSYFVVDEAHCVDKWGDAFRPSYRALGEVRHKLGDPPMLAFTATAGPRTRARILEALDVPSARVILHDIDRPNIALLRIDGTTDAKRIDVIKSFVAALRAGPGGRVLVFVPTIRKGNEVERSLKKNGPMRAAFFHGRLSPKDRDYLQGRFEGRLEPQLDVMVCTSAFGMGIDIPDVRIVFHWQHPASTEDYLQEFGRAGRDGRLSLAVLFRSQNDSGLLDFMLSKTLDAATHLSLPEKTRVYREKKAAIAEMQGLAMRRKGCFRKGILTALGDTGRRRRSLAVRLLEWIFAEKRPKSSTQYCCDACARLRTDAEKVQWGLEVIGRMDQGAL